MTLASRGLKPITELAAEKPHGTRLRYIAGRHCFQCRRANSDYERQRKAARLAISEADDADTVERIYAAVCKELGELHAEVPEELHRSRSERLAALTAQ